LVLAARGILKNIHAANECLFRAEYNRRLALLKTVIDDCNYMVKIVEICVELGYIDLRRCEHWSKLILDIKHMTMSWRRKDGERTESLIRDAEARQTEKEKAMIREIAREVMAHK
jgi:hypothetical protein